MRNFRMNLISKCIGDAGAAEADAEFLGEVLRGPGDTDLPKLRNYVWRHAIPANYRIEIYKKLLGVSSCYKETREIIDSHRDDEVVVLLRCLMNIRAYSEKYDDNDQPTPTTSDIVKLILLSRSRLQTLDVELDVKNLNAMDSIVRSSFVITRRINAAFAPNWKDVFHISRQIIQLLEKVFDEKTLSDTIRQIEISTGESTSDDIKFWLKSAFCGVINSQKPLLRVLDKLVTGHGVVSLLRNLAIAFVSTGDDVKLSEEQELRLVSKAIDQT